MWIWTELHKLKLSFSTYTLLLKYEKTVNYKPHCVIRFEFGMAPGAHVLKTCFLDGGVPRRDGDWERGCGGGEGHGNFWRWGLAGGSRLLGHVLRAVFFSAFSGLLLLPGCNKARSSLWPHPSAVMLFFPAASQTTELPRWAKAFLLDPVMLGIVSDGL